MTELSGAEGVIHGENGHTAGASPLDKVSEGVVERELRGAAIGVDGDDGGPSRGDAGSGHAVQTSVSESGEVVEQMRRSHFTPASSLGGNGR